MVKDVAPSRLWWTQYNIVYTRRPNIHNVRRR
jgi:hypothetical protein